MPIYELEVSGKTFEVEAPNEDMAVQAIIQNIETSLPKEELQEQEINKEQTPLPPYQQIGGRLVQTPIQQDEEISIGEQIQAIPETLKIAGLGAVGGTVGTMAGTLKGGYDRILNFIEQGFTEDAVKEAKKMQATAEEYASALTPTPVLEATKGQLETVAEIAEPLAALTPLAVEAQALKTVATTPSKTQLVKETIEEVTPDRPKLLTPKAQREFKSISKIDPTNKDIARYELVNNKVKFDKTADEAIKQGFEDRVISSVKASTPKDRVKMKQMLNIHKLGKKSAKFAATNRPADIVGKSVEDRIKFLANTKKTAGKEIEKAANDLKGTYVNYDNSVEKFLQDLDDMGVNVYQDKNKLKINLRGSDIEGDVASQKLLNKIFTRLVDTDVPDGYGIHKAKRFLDTQVSYGKRAANPLSAKTENIVKGLRRNLNEALGEASEKYKLANTKFSDSLNALEDIQKAAGTKVNLNSPNVDKALGGSMRKILSNYGSRVQTIDALDNIEKVAQKYGMKKTDDIVNQIIFVNEIDRMFGSPAPTSFKGQISQAIETGTEAAQKGIIGGTVDLAKKGIEKARGINEENAIKAMETILNKNYGESYGK